MRDSRYCPLTGDEKSAKDYPSKPLSRVVDVFDVIWRQFGFTEVHNRDLENNTRCVFKNKCCGYDDAWRKGIRQRFDRQRTPNDPQVASRMAGPYCTTDFLVII
jgi:hypothetical protein